MSDCGMGIGDRSGGRRRVGRPAGGGQNNVPATGGSGAINRAESAANRPLINTGPHPAWAAGRCGRGDPPTRAESSPPAPQGEQAVYG